MKAKIKANHNRYTFGLGTVGRDMLYSMVSMYLMYFLTDILTEFYDVVDDGSLDYSSCLRCCK